jgi:hypothetical protein
MLAIAVLPEKTAGLATPLLRSKPPAGQGLNCCIEAPYHRAAVNVKSGGSVGPLLSFFAFSPLPIQLPAGSGQYGWWCGLGFPVLALHALGHLAA